MLYLLAVLEGTTPYNCPSVEPSYRKVPENPIIEVSASDAIRLTANVPFEIVDTDRSDIKAVHVRATAGTFQLRVERGDRMRWLGSYRIVPNPDPERSAEWWMFALPLALLVRWSLQSGDRRAAPGVMV